MSFYSLLSAPQPPKSLEPLPQPPFVNNETDLNEAAKQAGSIEVEARRPSFDAATACFKFLSEGGACSLLMDVQGTTWIANINFSEKIQALALDFINLEKNSGLEMLVNLKIFKVDNFEADKGSLDCLSKMKQLHTLSLKNKRNSQFREENLKLDADFLAIIRKIKTLRCLDLMEGSISPADLDGFDHLESLTLWRVNFKDGEGPVKFPKNLSYAQIYHVWNFGEEWIKALAANRHLEKLVFYCCDPQIESERDLFRHLGEFESLKSLSSHFELQNLGSFAWNKPWSLREVHIKHSSPLKYAALFMRAPWMTIHTHYASFSHSQFTAPRCGHYSLE